MNIIKRFMSVFFAICFLLSANIVIYAEENTDLEYEIEEENPYDLGEEEQDPYDLGEEEDFLPEEITPDIPAEVTHGTSDDTDDKEQTEINYEESIASMKAFALLNAIGIKIDNENKQNLLSRDKAAMLIALLSNCSDSLDDQKTYFTDVDFENECLKYINYGYERGYFSGIGNGQFAPFKGITSLEFATAILRSAGYTDYAEIAGGYSSKYLSLAMKYDLLDGVSVKTSDVLTMQDAVIIMANALDLPYCEMSAIENGNTIYSMNEERTLLEVNFDIIKYTGILCSTPDASIQQCSRASEETVLLSIDGKKQVFRYRESDVAYCFLGQTVYAYADKDNLLHYMDSKYTLERVFIQFNQINMISPDRTYIKYLDENDKNKTAKIEYDAVFIRNGIEDNTLTVQELMLPNSSMELIDADRDGKYDVVIYEERQIIIAETLHDPIYTWGVNLKPNFDTLFGEMYPEYVVEQWYSDDDAYRSYTVSEQSKGKSVQLDPDSDEYSLNLIMDGKEIKYTDVKIGDVLSVCDSSDGKKRKVYVSQNSIETKISSIDKGNKTIETSDGNVYIYSFNIDDTSLLGKTVTVYLDHYGIAVAYKLITKELVYGYLLNYAGSRDDLSRKWQAEIYDMDKTTRIYDFAEKFKHNDGKGEHKSFEQYFNSTGHQLIKYSLNDEGKINKIYTSYTPEGYTLRSEKPVFVLNEHYNGDTGKIGVNKNWSFEFEYDTQSVTRLVVVVDDNGNVVDEGVYKVSSFAKDQRQDMRIYDATVGKVATFMVCTVKESDVLTMVGNSRKPVVIGEIRYDEEGKFLVGMAHLGDAPFLIHLHESYPGIFSGVKEGDVIRLQRYLADKDGRYRVSHYEKLFTLNAELTDDTASTICADAVYTAEKPSILKGTNSHGKILYGDVVALGPADTTDTIEPAQYTIVLQPEGTTLPEDATVFTFNRVDEKGGPLFKYYKDTDTLEKREGYTLKAGDKIFAITNYYNASFIVIYE